MYSVQELAGTEEATERGRGRGFNPAHPWPQQLGGEKSNFLHYNAMWAQPPAVPGSAAVAQWPQPRPRPLLPAGLSPLLQEAPWPRWELPQGLQQTKIQRGQQQPAELPSLLGRRLQGWLPSSRSAQVLSVSS